MSLRRCIIFSGIVVAAGFVAATAWGMSAAKQSADVTVTGPPTTTTTDVEELGRLLFWDPMLSGEQDVACATCHHPDFAYADGRALSLGVGAVGLGPDRVDVSTAASVDQTRAPMFWDSRVRGLETQALEPLPVGGLIDDR